MNYRFPFREVGEGRNKGSSSPAAGGRAHPRPEYLLLGDHEPARLFDSEPAAEAAHIQPDSRHGHRMEVGRVEPFPSEVDVERVRFQQLEQPIRLALGVAHEEDFSPVVPPGLESSHQARHPRVVGL